MASASDGDVIYEDHLYKLCGQGRTLLWSKKNQWKQRYFVLKRYLNRPVLEYYVKKPKHKKAVPKVQIYMSSGYKVEKVTNLKSRAYVFELTTPETSLCLSADEQRGMDVFVFFLLIQSRLKEEIRDGFFSVLPENSESQRRVGAKGAKCILQVSPFGITLALESCRSVLAQWPLKSIRSYESSGQGSLVLDIGRVAPMGDGQYIFHVDSGHDDKIYDLIDRYVMDSLEKVQPNRRGTREEIEDYMLEAERLLALTTVKPSSPLELSEIRQILRDSWSLDMNDKKQSIAKTVVHTRLANSRPGVDSTQSGTHPPLPPIPNRNILNLEMRNSPQVFKSDNFTRGGIPPFDSSSQSPLSGRPPFPTPGSRMNHGNTSSIPVVMQGREQMSYMRMKSSGSQVSSLSAFSPTSSNWSPPPPFQDVFQMGSVSPEVLPSSSHNSRSHFMMNGSNTLQSDEQYLTALHDDCATNNGQKSDFIDRNGTNTTVAEHSERKLTRLRSVSCEGVDDYLRSVMYQEDGVFKSMNYMLDEVNSDDDEELLPEPFPRLQTFSGSINWSPDACCPENYYNIEGRKGEIDESPGLPVRELRKRYSENIRGWHKMRRSVSNPNFVRIASKEKLYEARLKAAKSPNNLESQRPQSKSLIDLLSDSLRRKPRNRSKPSTLSQPSSPSSRRASSLSNVARSIDRGSGQPDDFVSRTSVKGISVTKRSRSFKRMKHLETNQLKDKSESSSENGPIISSEKSRSPEKLKSGLEGERTNNRDSAHSTLDMHQSPSSSSSGMHKYPEESSFWHHSSQGSSVGSQTQHSQDIKEGNSQQLDGKGDHSLQSPDGKRNGNGTNLIKYHRLSEKPPLPRQSTQEYSQNRARHHQDDRGVVENQTSAILDEHESSVATIV
ncbi:hypothetical protein CHS0354_001306 [Potamilus streckersoni]|uniref:PH domain-containing protein n=1 Tax=Potamilus streckersoni TaxID=2493646 RepID=A0AAE0RV80_9BIVA|nr:hypothetical protein CHS0354_001306 [Potamilus streckersoni]